MNEVQVKGRLAKQASQALVSVTTEEKNDALAKIANQLRMNAATIVAANEKDIEAGKQNGLDAAVLDRIMLNEKRIDDMADAIQLLIELDDPIGEILETIEKENGLQIVVRRVPIGVIGMIYEARPNVTVDAATLALKTSNAVILRGSSSARHSNMALIEVIHRALEQTAIPVDAIQLIEDTRRETAKQLFQLNDYLDVLIPRGGKALIETVVREATVPVIETGAGNCHIYIDETADVEMATTIVLNAKTQRPSVCNAAEKILIHEQWFTQYGKELVEKLHAAQVEVIGDEQVVTECPQTIPATDEDWNTEYLSLTVAMKVVHSVDEAIAHINKHGTKHSEVIVTADEAQAAQFLNRVDAAAVYHNASTRFTDGFEFGYGAEMGISTQKLHARGPMGLKALTSSKYTIYGTGQVRA